MHLTMPKFLSTDEVAAILASGEFEGLIGVVEDGRLEFKGAPYKLGEETAKAELAKDVSALGNSEGGMVLVGPQTAKDPEHLGDEVKNVSCLPRSAFDVDQYLKVLRDWIYPPVRHLQV